jgi:hypothetical protein
LHGIFDFYISIKYTGKINMKSYKRRRFSNKKTRRIKRRGGMYKSRLYPNLSPKDRAAAHEKDRVNDPRRNKELTAAHTVLTQMVSRGVSHRDRMAALSTGTGALAGHMSGLLLADKPHLLHRYGHAALGAARPHTSIPALFDAADMFQQAEQLCSRVRELPDAEMWTRSKWGEMTCTPEAKRMCTKAVALYKGAIAHKYLPAYAPLAWMMSYSRPKESLRLCDECIAVCKTRIGAPFARKAKTDCTALRAFVQCEQFMSDQEFAEGLAPGGHMVYEISAKPSMEKLKKIESHSTRYDSKYGYALRWQLLTFQDELADWTPGLMMMPVKAAEEAAETAEAAEAAKTIAEGMGLDFERCRFC